MDLAARFFVMAVDSSDVFRAAAIASASVSIVAFVVRTFVSSSVALSAVVCRGSFALRHQWHVLWLRSVRDQDLPEPCRHVPAHPVYGLI